MLTSKTLSLLGHNIQKPSIYEAFVRQSQTIAKPIDGTNATAVVFGGLGYRERKLKKYSSMYGNLSFNTVPVLSTVKELTTPVVALARGKKLAKILQNANQPLVIHTVSASFWTVIYMLEHMQKEWREENVKAIVFDSCPAENDVYSLGGWFTFNSYLKPYVSPLSDPYNYLSDVTEDWRYENHLKIFGKNSVIPKNANILFIHAEHDPILNKQYLAKFVEDIKVHQSSKACITEEEFDKSQNTMSVIDYREEYKKLHVNNLLGKVPEWSL